MMTNAITIVFFPGSPASSCAARDFSSSVRRRPRSRRHGGARDCARARDAAEKQDGGSQPQQDRRRLERRLVEDEVAVAVGHVREDLVVALAGGDLLADLRAQIVGELGVRVGDRLVLADEAAQLFRELDGARRLDRIHLGRHRVGGERPAARRERERGEQGDEEVRIMISAARARAEGSSSRAPRA